MVSRNSATNPGSSVAPPGKSSEVSSQSTRPSFRAMKPSRLAAMWMVTRVLTLGSERAKHGSGKARARHLALGLREAIGRHDLAAAVRDVAPVRDHLLAGILARVDMIARRKSDVRRREVTATRTQDRPGRRIVAHQREQTRAHQRWVEHT